MNATYLVGSKRGTRLFRSIALAMAGLFTLGVTALSENRVAAQPPPPPVNVKITMPKQKVDDNTYKVKLKITAEVTGVAKNTFETEWINVDHNKPSKPIPVETSGIFKVTGSVEWKGDTITAKGSVEAGVGNQKLKKSFSASAKVE